jgi:hypothetical protein
MISHDGPLQALASVDDVRARLSARTPSLHWKTGVMALAVGGVCAALALDSDWPWVIGLLVAVVTGTAALSAHEHITGIGWGGIQVRGRDQAAALILLILVAEVADRMGQARVAPWIGLGFACGVAAACFVMVAVVERRFARHTARRHAGALPNCSLNDALRDAGCMSVLVALDAARGPIAATVLPDLAGVSDLDLNATLDALDEAGYVKVRRPRSSRGLAWVRATPRGAHALDGHVAALRASAS